MQLADEIRHVFCFIGLVSNLLGFVSFIRRPLCSSSRGFLKIIRPDSSEFAEEHFLNFPSQIFLQILPPS